MSDDRKNPFDSAAGRYIKTPPPPPEPPKKPRPRLAFDPAADEIRAGLDRLGESLDLSPGSVLNYGALLAIVQLLEGDPDALERRQPIRQLKFGTGLNVDDLAARVRELLTT